MPLQSGSLRAALAPACALVVLALAACGAEPVPPTRVATLLWPSNELLYLAEHHGNLDARAFRLVEYISNAEVTRAFRNGAVDVATMTLDEVVLAVRDGADPVIILAMDESRGADAVLAHPGTNRIADLAGKRVGVQLNSVSAYLLRRALEAGATDAQALTIVNVPPDRHLRMFRSGELDAVVTYEPVRTQVMQAGAVDLFNSAAIPGEIVDVLVAQRGYLGAQPDRIAALVAAWEGARLRFRDSVDARAWVAGRLGETPAELERTMQVVRLYEPADNRRLFLGERPELFALLGRIKAAQRRDGLVAEDVATSGVLDVPRSLAERLWSE